MSQAASFETRVRKRNYDRAAWFYDLSSRVYSTNQIRKSKNAQLEWIEPGQRVLYLGCGGGEDSRLAAKKGAQVTCIDISQRMVQLAENRFENEGLSAEFICDDVRRHLRFGHYDVVAANYFLNCFREAEMIRMLASTSKLLKPGGLYMIADVALPSGNFWERQFNYWYLKWGKATFWMLGLVPWGPNFDYVSHFESNELELVDSKQFRFAKKGPILFQNLVARKSEQI